MDEKKTHQDIYDTCKRHMHSYVLVETTDGFQTDGIITGLDEENVYLAVPVEEVQQNIPVSGQQVTPNQFGGGYPYNPYPGYGRDPRYGRGYGRGYPYPPRRFRRLVIPLAVLATLSLLPWY